MAVAVVWLYGISAIVGSEGVRYPGALAAAVTFALVQVFAPSTRINWSNFLSPRNWTVLVFGIQLLAMPLLLQLFGPVAGELRTMPSTASINAAFLVVAIAYVSFAVGLSRSLRSSNISDIDRFPTSSAGRSAVVPPAATGALLAIGAIGLVLRFDGGASLVDYFHFGGSQATQTFDQPATLTQAASSFLLPCLGFSFAMLWCRMAEMRVRENRWSTIVVLRMSVVTMLILLAFSLYNYNRGAVVVAAVALAATFSARVQRIPTGVLLAAAAGLLVATLWFGALRASYYQSAGRYVIAQSDLSSIEFNKNIQVYGSGPQFLGFMIEVSDRQVPLYLGRTLIPSVMYPVPVLGRDLRPDSGPAIYNQAVYGFGGVTDQIIPFDGELYWNFRLPGVVGGFVLLGLLVGRLHRRFESSANAWQAFVTMYAAIWAGFLIVGAISVVAQVALYFGWPLVGLALVHRLRRDGRRSGSSG